MKISDYFSKDGLTVVCFSLPLVLKWLLPPGLEERLYFMVGVVNVFIPNLLLIVLPILFPISSIYNKKIKNLFLLWCFVHLLVVILSESPNFLINIVSNSFLFGSLYLGLFHQITERQIKLLNPILLVSMIVLSLQIILLSTGTLNFDLSTRGESFGGIYRVYTTAGESTGTGLILNALILYLLLTIIHLKYKLVLAIFGLVAVCFTVSRTSIAIISISYFYFWFVYYRKKVKYSISLLLLLLTLFSIGVFQPIIDRNSEKTTDGNLSSGRDILIEQVIDNVNSKGSKWFGFGVGNVYQTTEIAYSRIKMPYRNAPHNSYILLYAEQGIIGILFFTALLIYFYRKRFKCNRDVGFILILFFLLAFNTETVICTNSEYVYLLSLFLMLMNSKTKYELIPKINKI